MHARDTVTSSAAGRTIELPGRAGAGDDGAARRPRARIVAWLAWGSLVLTTALITLNLAFEIANEFRPRPDESDGRINAFTTPIFLLYAIAGTMIARRHPGNAIGWILCLTGVLVALSSVARQYAIYSLFTAPGDLPGGVTAAWLNNWLGISWAFLAIVYLPLLFPDGRLPSRRWRLVGWLAALGTILVVLYDAFAPGVLDRWPPLENPYAAPGVAGTIMTVFAAGYFLLPVCGLAAVASLIVRLRRARGDERAQLQWFLLGAGAVVAGSVGVFLLEAPLGLPHGVAVVPQMLTFAVIPVVVAIAILKYRLYDIDVVINRTLVYATLTALVVAAYALAVSVADAVVPDSDSFVVSLAATGIIAVLFQPVRERVQRAVNRLLYGERDEPYRVLSRLGRRLEGTLAPETVLPTVVQTVREALNVPYAAVALAGDDEAVAASGTPTGDVLPLPLVYQNETVGELHVAPRRPGEAFGPADRRLLEDLARQAGVAVHAVRLTADLQRSRERLVTAREEERRRLRRDLHDGLGPQLAGLTLRLETARNRLAPDPLADSLLSDLTERTQAAVRDIRRLVYALRPPALDDLGLVSALREGAAQYGVPGTGGMDVTVEAPDGLPPLPAAVEVAAYRIAQEALTNVVRHAGARSCAVALLYDDAAAVLTVTVTDDGRGPPADARAGVGLTSMRERAEELGGTLRVEAAPGSGTRVAASLPCRLPAAEVAS